MIAKPSFFAELQRRHVYKVGASYAVAGWLLVQVATQVFPFFDIPNVAVRIVVLLVVAGFPAALVLAWLFDLTPTGIVRTDEVPPGTASVDHAVGQRGVDRRLNYLLGFLLFAAVGYLALEHTVLRRTLSAPTAAEGVNPEKSIAVLPFENLSNDPNNAYFAAGIQDEILTQLARIGDLKVISRTSTAHYASRPEDLPAIARELGVENILEGSVQKAGDTVHINVQLIHAASDAHLWADTYDRKLDNVFGVEGEVAAAIAGKLQATLSGAEKKELEKWLTDSPVAYEAYLKGQATLRSELSRASLESAVNEFKQAIAADPKFADAWIGQADARINIYGVFVHRPEDGLLIKQELDEALRLQPESPKAWRSLGRYYRNITRDFPAASDALEHALRLAPNDSATLLSTSVLYAKLGRWGDARATAAHAAELDPRNPDVWAHVADFAQSSRRYSEALSALDREAALVDDKSEIFRSYASVYLDQGSLPDVERSIAHVPFDFQNPDVYLGVYSPYWRYARKYTEGIETWDRELVDKATHPAEDIVTGTILRADILTCAGEHAKANLDYEDARKRLQALTDSGATNYEIGEFLGPVLAALGQRDDALTTARKALADVQGNTDYAPTARLSLAEVEMRLGDPQAAVAQLEASFEEPGGIAWGALHFDCLWDPVRGSARFRALEAKAQSQLASPK